MPDIFIQASLAIAPGIVAARVLPMVFGEESATRKAVKFHAPVEGKACGSGSHESIAILLVDDQSLKGWLQSRIRIPTPSGHGRKPALVVAVSIAVVEPFSPDDAHP